MANASEMVIFEILAAGAGVSAQKAKKPEIRKKKKAPTKSAKEKEAKKERPKHHKPKAPPKKDGAKKSLFKKPAKAAKKSLFSPKKKSSPFTESLDEKEKKLGRPFGPKKGGKFDKSYRTDKKDKKSSKPNQEGLLTAEDLQDSIKKLKAYMERKNTKTNHKTILNNMCNQLNTMSKQYQ